MVPFPSVGEFRVEFQPYEWDGIPGGCAIQPHYEYPHQMQVTTATPYEGPLCAHELAYLKGFPGRDMPWNWHFIVTPLGEVAEPAGLGDLLDAASTGLVEGFFGLEHRLELPPLAPGEPPPGFTPTVLPRDTFGSPSR